MPDLTRGSLVPLKEGGYRFEWEKPKAIAAPVPQMRELSTDERVAKTFSETMTDQVSAFVCGGMDKDRTLYRRWLQHDGLVEIWKQTNYGRRPTDAA